MRRTAGLLALLCLLATSGCTPQVETPSTIRIGVALYQQDDTFLGTMMQDFESLAQTMEQERDLKITLNLVDAKGSQATQNDQVDRFLALSYDIICINIVDRTSASILIDKAKAKDIPILFFNREPVQEDLDRWEGAYYVGSQAALAGQLQGEMVADAWQAADPDLDRNGDGILQYVMLEGEPGHQDALLRSEYSVRALESRGISTERLATESANWSRGQAASQMTQWLAQFGGEIELILSNNDDMALGAIDAYRDAGLLEDLPCIVGVDATPAALTALAEGQLLGTVLNDAQGQATYMLELAYLLATGQDPGQSLPLEDGNYIWLEYTAVTG